MKMMMTMRVTIKTMMTTLLHNLVTMTVVGVQRVVGVVSAVIDDEIGGGVDDQHYYSPPHDDA